MPQALRRAYRGPGGVGCSGDESRDPSCRHRWYCRWSSGWGVRYRRRGGGPVRGALGAELGQSVVRVSEGPSTAPTVRELEVRFVNEKELPTIVLDMWVAHYKGDEPLEEWARPDLMFGSGSPRLR
jgi:hypothetical protein